MCYGPQVRFNDKNERQADMLRRYGFNCKCRPCEENWPVIEDDCKVSFQLFQTKHNECQF